jgi:oligoribonuclease NrnB/cAMP/cGMP phosphodiesterase (DHH superfamily)
MNTTLVIHHSADLDGICSREVARKALGESADYLGWDYGQPIPDLAPYETVYLIDISLPREVMVDKRAKLIWIDHHKSAIEANEWLNLRGYRIDGVAACRLAWQWFFRSTDIPTLPEKDRYVDQNRVGEPLTVELLGRYDIWDKRDERVDPFQLGMQAEKAPDWNLLLKEDDDPYSATIEYVDSIIQNGRTIQSYTEVMNAQISQERGFDVAFERLTFRALNVARCNSMAFTASIKPHHEGCLAYYWNGKKWRFSLYHVDHRKDIDLSKIAVKFGGGGHAGACGFELATLPPELGGANLVPLKEQPFVTSS